MRRRCAQIVPARRNKALLSLDDGGAAALDYMTSQRRLATIRRHAAAGAGRPLAPAATPCWDWTPSGGLTAWRILCPHPEVSWRTLFGKVQYEGYDEPDYVWQTTGGDDYEPKMSLVPLLFGTLKATFYAMLLRRAAVAGGGGLRQPLHLARLQAVDQAGGRDHGRLALGGDRLHRRACGWRRSSQRDLASLLVLLLTLPATLLAFLLLWQMAAARDWARADRPRPRVPA